MRSAAAPAQRVCQSCPRLLVQCPEHRGDLRPEGILDQSARRAPFPRDGCTSDDSSVEEIPARAFLAGPDDDAVLPR